VNDPAVDSSPEIADQSTVRASWYFLLLGFIVLCGAVLRIYNLGAESLWRDEAISIYLAKQPIWEMLKNRADKSHAPLYFLLLKPWVGLFGDSEFAVRMFSVSAALGSIPMIAALGTALFKDRRVGLVAAALLCFSPLHVEYSQETRMYTLAVLLALVSTHCLFRLMREGTRARWICYLVSTIVLIYEHNSAWFIVGIHNCMVLGRTLLFREPGGPPLRKWAWAQLVLVGSFVPWMIMFSVYEGWEPGAREPNLRQLTEPVVAFAGSVQMLAAYSAAALLGLLAIRPGEGTGRGGPLRRLSRLRFSRDWRPYALLAWALLPVAILFALTVTVSMKYQVRYTIVAVAGLYLLAARGLARLPGAALPFAGVALFAALAIAPLGNYYTLKHKADWRGSVAYIEALADSGDLVFVDCSRPERDKKCSWDYYARRDDLRPEGIPFTRLKIKGKKRKMPAHEVTEHRRFWLLRLDSASYKYHVWWLEKVGYKARRYRKFNHLKAYLLERPPGKVELPTYESVFDTN
jgi:mannosyltransferase